MTNAEAIACLERRYKLAEKAYDEAFSRSYIRDLPSGPEVEELEGELIALDKAIQALKMAEENP